MNYIKIYCLIHESAQNTEPPGASSTSTRPSAEGANFECQRGSLFASLKKKKHGKKYGKSLNLEERTWTHRKFRGKTMETSII